MSDLQRRVVSSMMIRMQVRDSQEPLGVWYRQDRMIEMSRG